ncbi:MAG: polysaccharide biosynthesis/export family protein [Parvularculaceae bacterium]
MILRALIGLAAIALSACSTSYPPLEEAAASPYRLGPGDEIRVTVFRLEELTNTYVVSDTGAVSLPLLRPIRAEGKTIAELESELEAAVASKDLVREPSVTAQVSKYRPFFVVGEVQRPGQYPYVPNMTVLTAISIAGGPTFRANTDKIVVTRIIDGRSQTGRARSESLVLPGDTINVYEGWF